jgi:hypothetical protein
MVVISGGNIPPKKASSSYRWLVLLLAIFVCSQASMYWLWTRSTSAVIVGGCQNEQKVLSVPSRAELHSRVLLSSTIGTNLTKVEDADMEDEDLGGVIPRAFEPWPRDVPLPCVRPDDKWWHPLVTRTPSHEGFLYMKEMKCGSSTLAGVTLRIARNVARRRTEAGEPWFEGARPICKARFDHTSAWRLDYGNRIKHKSFLWTVIREPSKRMTSEFFHFEVSRKKSEPSDENFLTYILSRPYSANYYLRDLQLTPPANFSDGFVYGPPIAEGTEAEVANSILQGYDFVGVTERMHESLVALQMILGLETNDILYLKAKSSGNWDDGAANNQTCVYIVPSFQSPGMKKYFASNHWKNNMSGDYLLYRAAHKSLDMTIERLGRQDFEKNLAKFERAMQVASETCKKVLWPCSSDGKRNFPNDCLWLDSGCGVQCLDDLKLQQYR